MNIDEATRLANLELAVFGGPNPNGTIPPSSSQQPQTTLTGSADALPLYGDVLLASSGVDATTLATPVAGGQQAGGDDGKRLRVTDVGGHAHTITVATNKLAPSHHLLTFAGTIGNFVDLEAAGGLWYVKATAGVTAS